MARLNLTIPDSLYERYEGARDRLNVSKVCAEALERELDMLDARPSMTDPRVIALAERLRGTKETWKDYGYKDGWEWGLEKSTRADFTWVASHTIKDVETELNDYEAEPPPREPFLAPVIRTALAAYEKRVKHNDDTQSDRAAYLAGWFDALRVLYKQISGALR